MHAAIVSYSFYKSINVIRWKHTVSSKGAMGKSRDGISQKDMVLTQFGFIGYVLTSPRLFGLSDSLDERQGITHFWRVIGHLLGIPDR